MLRLLPSIRFRGNSTPPNPGVCSPLPKDPFLPHCQKGLKAICGVCWQIKTHAGLQVHSLSVSLPPPPPTLNFSSLWASLPPSFSFPWNPGILAMSLGPLSFCPFLFLYCFPAPLVAYCSLLAMFNLLLSLSVLDSSRHL